MNDGADVEKGGICKEMYVLYVHSRLSDQDVEEGDRKIGH